MPPVRMTAVRARESRPISTLARATSAALPAVKKFDPAYAK
jgi:hypothetical protein